MAGFDILHDIKVYDDSGRELLLQRLNTFTWEITVDASVVFDTYDKTDHRSRTFHKCPFVFDNPINGYVSGTPDGSEYHISVDQNGTFKIKNEYLSGLFNRDYNEYNTTGTKQPVDYVEHLFNRFAQCSRMNFILYDSDKDTYYSLCDMYRGFGQNILKWLYFEISEQKFYEDADEDSDYSEYYVSGVKIQNDQKISEIINDAFYNNSENSLVKICGIQNNLYPFFRIIGSYETESVSVELISSNTLFILDDKGKRPYIELGPNQYAFLTAKTPDNSELKFISANKDTAEVDLTSQLIYDLSVNNDEHEPLVFPIGFTAQDEGCYENPIELFVTALNKFGELGSYYIGSIYVKSTAIGEDERYRALFDNFGIPDPLTYPNIFKEKDVDEEGIDYELINRKSKELFLTYDQIFPYVGTYKALINAVRFLGYDDVFFKEWYKIIDTDGTDRTVAFESINPQSNESLQSKLKRHGITYEEFLNYKKLNRLSLIYRLNVEDDDHEHIYAYNKSTSERINVIVQNPTTKDVYDYTSDALIAKLVYLKRWLEKYIIGVNCQIQDITGEGVYFYRFKSQIYANTYRKDQIEHQKPITPKPVDDVVEMKSSAAYVKCTLHEFTSLKFKHFENVRLGDMLDKVIDVSDIANNSNTGTLYGKALLHGYDGYKPAYTVVEPKIPVSVPFECAVPYDEISFNIESITGNGTLHECQKGISANNPIYIHDNELYIYGDAHTSWIDDDKLPVIQLNQANIRKPFNNWKSNVLFSIKTSVDAEKESNIYTICQGTRSINQTRPIMLRPGARAKFRYTERTKWSEPLLIFSNYFIDLNNDLAEDGMFALESDKDYVLEILDGKLLFNTMYSTSDADDTEDPDDVNTRLQIEVDFGYNYNTTTNLNEQQVSISYNYIGQRNRIYSIKSNLSQTQIDFIKTGVAKEKVTFLGSQTAYINACLQKFIYDAWTKYEIIKYLEEEYHSTQGIVNKKLVYFCERLVNSYRKVLVNKIRKEKSIPNTLAGNISLFSTCDPQVKDFIAWLFSDARFEEYKKTCLKQKESEIDKRMYDKFETLYRNNAHYSVKKNHSIKVNHIGKYNITGIGYDAYNNAFISKSSNSAKVVGEAPVIDIYINSPKSNNDKDFYPYNCNGEFVSKLVKERNKMVLKSDAERIINNINTQPRFPKTYRIFDMDIRDNRITYDAISYVLDTPKYGDYITLQNLSERCTQIAEYDSAKTKYFLYMLDENPGDISLFQVNTICCLVVYDNYIQDFVNVIQDLKVVECHKVDDLSDDCYNDDSYLVVTANDELRSLYQDRDVYFSSGRYNIFIMNTTKYAASVISDTQLLIQDYKFKPNDVIKIIIDYNLQNNDDRVADYITYKIADVETGLLPNTQIITLTKPFVYDCKFENVNLYVTYANELPVIYKVKCTSDAQEFADVNSTAQIIKVDMHTYAFNSVKTTRTTLTYDPDSWFATDYLDDTYTGFVQDYNPQELQMDWCTRSDLNRLAGRELYKYENWPVTVVQGRYLIVGHTDKNGTIAGDYIVNWAWYADSLHQVSMNNANGQGFHKYDNIIYRSIDDYMAIKTHYTGRNDIVLTAIDLYGNEFVNKKEGLIRVTNK